nr:50S ribosomal protein L11 methyltransferase [uncultured Peptoniphilus sp.]
MQYKMLTIIGDHRRQEEGELFLQEHGVDSYEVISGDAVDNLKEGGFIWDAIDEDLLEVDADRFELKAYFDASQEKERHAIKKEAQDKGFEVEERDVPDQDWANDWKSYFHPISIDEGLTIVPSWEDYEPKEGEEIIILDPGMAFGSGNHATSFLCSRYLREYMKQGDTVIDIGCGSGILSLVAVKSGAEKVIAVDLDPQCMIATEENAQKNNMLDSIDTREGDLFSVVTESADVVVSNIFAEVIIGMLHDVKHHVKPGGIYIASGILKEKLQDVMDALEREGFELLDDKTDGDWSAVAARRLD